jgi:hypothetical protein
MDDASSNVCVLGIGIWYYQTIPYGKDGFDAGSRGQIERSRKIIKNTPPQRGIFYFAPAVGISRRFAL